MRIVWTEQTKKGWLWDRTDVLITGSLFKGDTSQALDPTQSYQTPHAFTPFLADEKPLIASNEHAISFFSLSGNILIVPRGPYVTMLSFLKNAPDDAQQAFWALTAKLYNQLHAHGYTTFQVATHVGSLAGQTVPHFHLRFELTWGDKARMQRETDWWGLAPVVKDARSTSEFNLKTDLGNDPLSVAIQSTSSRTWRSDGSVEKEDSPTL